MFPAVTRYRSAARAPAAACCGDREDLNVEH